MSLRVIRTRRQKRIDAESSGCNRSLKKTPQTPLQRKALKDLQPSSDSPKLLVGSKGSVRHQVNITTSNAGKVLPKQKSSISETTIIDTTEKENVSSMKRKAPSSRKPSSIRKNSSVSRNSSQVSKKSNVSRQSKILEFTKSPEPTKIKDQTPKKQDLCAEKHCSWKTYTDLEKIESICLSEDYETKAEELRCQLAKVLKQNEDILETTSITQYDEYLRKQNRKHLCDQLQAIEADNTALKEIVEQIVHFRNLLQDYEEELEEA